uniref:Uncharacterized protein n=1 Tax=Cucumis melo TaxID=3656 RepID=A0A9I9EDM4_CUCME
MIRPLSFAFVILSPPPTSRFFIQFSPPTVNVRVLISILLEVVITSQFELQSSGIQEFKEILILRMISRLIMTCMS